MEKHLKEEKQNSARAPPLASLPARCLRHRRGSVFGRRRPGWTRGPRARGRRLPCRRRHCAFFFWLEECSFRFSFLQFNFLVQACPFPRLSSSAAVAATAAAGGGGSASLSIASRSASLNASPCDRKAETWPPGTQRTSAPSDEGNPLFPGAFPSFSSSSSAFKAAPQCLASSSTADLET